MDGKEGKIYAFLQAYWYRYLVDAKIYECKKMGTRYQGKGRILFFTMIYGFIAIGFFVLANDFIELWIGNNYLLDQSVVFAILFSLYIKGSED